MTEPDAVDKTHLEKSQEAIDDAREAAKKVADSEDIEAGDLPAFADSTPGVDHANAFSDGEQDADSEQDVDSEQGAGSDPNDPDEAIDRAQTEN